MSFEPQELKSYFLLTGAYGPEYWVTSSVSCGGHQQSPIDISDQHARVSEEYQDLQLDGFDNESSNKTWMKNTGKTVAILLKDDYFVSGAGLPGRFKAEKVEFHWGHSNGSAGSEHSVNGRRFPVEVREGRSSSPSSCFNLGCKYSSLGTSIFVDYLDAHMVSFTNL
ncbi:hypothetical protein K5549_000318 [Capra hircus]|nr:hypothetical protein K5549_000318 [Capra hircus]